MMYFSRVRVMPLQRGFSQLLPVLSGDIYSIHQLIWTLFPEKAGQKRNFLFRQEFENEQIRNSANPRGMPLFYLLSHDKPLEKTDLLIVETKEYSPAILKGDELAFSIRVNPIIARKLERNGRECRRHDVLMDAKYHAVHDLHISDIDQIRDMQRKAVLEWFERAAHNNGFLLPCTEKLELSEYQQHLISKKGHSGKSAIRFSSVNIAGTLLVEDPAKFLKGIDDGFGRARSFGCGLMLIRRV